MKTPLKATRVALFSALLSAVLSLAPAFAGVVEMPVVPGQAGFGANPASITLAMQSQLLSLAPLAGSPQLLAQTLQTQLTAPGVQPAQVLAGQYIINSLSTPKALPLVQDFIARAKVDGGDQISANLAALAKPYKNPALRKEFTREVGPLQAIFKAQGTMVSPAQMGQSLNAMYENSRSGGEEKSAVASDSDASPTQKVFRPLRKGVPLADSATGINVSEAILDAVQDQINLYSIGPVQRPVVHKPLLEEPLTKPELQPDFVDIGMGPTGMMAMLAAVASGKTAVGVEMRGNPTRGVHQNIREEWFHQLAVVDQMMLDRYGSEAIPKLPNGKPFILADFFYNPSRVGGALDFHEIFGVGDEQNQNIAGRLDRISFEDARESTLKDNDGKSKTFLLPAPPLPEAADPTKAVGDMKAVLDSPSTFQAALINYEQMLRAYIKAMEEQDRKAGRKPRLKLYENHRVVQQDGVATGYVDAGGGKKRIIIEEIVDKRGENVGAAERVRKPGSALIDLGTPTRFALTAGYGGGADAKTLGYEQEDVVYESPTGEKIAATQNWIVGEVTANIGGQLLRRISTITDPKTGKKYTVRQIAVGHEQAPNVGWVPIQVPDFMDFDPIKAGKVPKGTDPKSAKYAAAAQKMIYDFYVSQVSAVTHIPVAKIKKMRMFYGPSLFTLKEKLGKTARVAANGNVAGDLMGNGHFLTSGGSMTGMIGHFNSFLSYWGKMKSGVPPDQAALELEADIKHKSEAWLHVSAKEFDGLSPANFGEERAKAIGIKQEADAPKFAEVPKPTYGLASVLGQSSWVRSFMRLLNGEFGRAGVDFYVPAREIDVTAAKKTTVTKIDLPGEKKP